MKALKAYNTEDITRFHQRKVHNTEEVVEIPQDDPPESSVPDTGPSDLPESDLAIPDVTENYAQHTFKAPCCCFENAPNTDLLFFEQSMRVLNVG